jgi:aldehyde:ferredoxin oxidoreductase
MKGWAGKILKVDLDREEIVKETTPQDLVEKYLGGAGIGAYFLYKNVPPQIKADSPKNWVIFATGPLNGTIIPSSGRTSVTFLSPVTGIFADSNAGADLGPELKFAGYDMVLITGRAKRPVYLWINDEEVELRDAGHLMGKTTWETDDLLRKELGDWKIKTALVGPSSQKGLLYGCLVINKYRAFGKTGAGSALAQKNMLGIAVRGRKGILLHDPSSFEATSEKILESMKSWEGFFPYSKYGTLGLADFYQESGRMPAKNRQELASEELYKSISADAFVKNFKVRDKACFNCPLHCSHWFEVKEGRYTGEKGDKPELVAVIAFGPLLGSYDYGAICHYQNECNRYGIDMMECGNTLALAFEAYQRGLITTKETDGIPLEWGNLDSIEKLFEKIVNFEGFGKILGLGVKRTSEWIGKGAEQFAIEVKGYGMSLAGTRNAPSWGLAFATASRGGDHLKALPAVVADDPKMLKDLFGEQPLNEIMSPVEPKGKGKVVAWFENYLAVLDSLGLCKLTYKLPWVHPREVARALSFATGISYNLEKLMKCGERICNVEKAFNARLGLTRKHDTLPRRFLEEPAERGARKGKQLGTVLPQMLDEYYKARGWDKQTGLPTRIKLESLGLKEIADELDISGQLAGSSDVK